MGKISGGATPLTPYILLVLAVLLIALTGYLGYAIYPRFHLPPVTGFGLLVLAIAAGIASFFSPCSFSLLIAILARVPETKKRQFALRNVPGFSTALALGATVFLLLTGAGIALGGAALFERVVFTSLAGRVIRTSIGVLLVFLGLGQAGFLPISFHGIEKMIGPLLRKDARLRRRAPLLGYSLFGFLYILAGFG